MDIITGAIFLATLAALLGGYAVWQAIGGALERVQRESDRRATAGGSHDGGRYVGGSDKLGSN
jgi:hypothetical protein